MAVQGSNQYVSIVLVKNGSLWKIHKVFRDRLRAEKYLRHQKTMELRIEEYDIQ